MRTSWPVFGYEATSIAHANWTSGLDIYEWRCKQGFLRTRVIKRQRLSGLNSSQGLKDNTFPFRIGNAAYVWLERVIDVGEHTGYLSVHGTRYLHIRVG